MDTTATESVDPYDLINPSLGTLLDGILDYAGLFPPAKLDIPTTVENYARFSQGEGSWMLSRLIIPVSRLDEFDIAAQAFLPRDPEEEPWVISAITVPAGDKDLEQNILRIEAFNNHHANPENGLAMIDVIELKGSDAKVIDDSLELLPDELFPFYEIPIGDDPRGLVATLVGNDAGAKVRTGGVTADLYPSVEDLARFIAACAATDVPFKATAGLHHPMRRFSETVQTTEHGHLNVFLAAAFANIKRFNESDIALVLAETDPAAFIFENEHVRWKEHTLGLDEIDETRSFFAISYGSCSFDEPLEELRNLNLL